MGDYHSLEYARALGRFQEMESVSDRGFYPIFRGYVLWMIGLTRFAMADVTNSITAYQAALTEFGQAGEQENAAAMHNLLFEPSNTWVIEIVRGDIDMKH